MTEKREKRLRKADQRDVSKRQRAATDEATAKKKKKKKFFEFGLKLADLYLKEVVSE